MALVRGSTRNARYARKMLVTWLIVCAFLAPSIAQPAFADEGEAIFQRKCASCHSIGQGRRVGPDLQGVMAKRDKSWVLAFITAPDKLIAQGDPVAKQLVQEYGMPMPNLGISAKDAEALVAYLDNEASAGKPGEAAAVAPSASPKPATVGDAAAGKALFTGQASFANGGVACVACHNASGLGGLGGGTVGKDLSVSYVVLGQAGLEALLKAPPFPIMKEAFANRSLTDAEIANIVAFLKQESSTATPVQNGYLFPILAGIFFLVIIGLVNVIWMRRLRGVRQPLIKGVLK